MTILWWVLENYYVTIEHKVITQNRNENFKTYLVMHEKDWEIQFQIWKSQSWKLLNIKLQFEHNILKWNRKPIWWCIRVNAKYRWVVLYHGFSFIENIDALIACCMSHNRYAPMVHLINFSSTKNPILTLPPWPFH